MYASLCAADKISGDLTSFGSRNFVGLGGLWDILTCFPDDVPIMTPTGDVPVQDLKVGNLVLSWNFAARKMVAREIIRIDLHERTQPIWQVAHQNDEENPLSVTPNHSIGVVEGCWKSVDQLKYREGIWVANRDRTALYPSNVAYISKPAFSDWDPRGCEPVRNIITKGEHNLFAAGIMTHNYATCRELHAKWDNGVEAVRGVLKHVKEGRWPSVVPVLRG